VLDDALLYFVCGIRHDLEQLLTAACEGGVDVLQLRAKDALDDEVVAAGRVFRRVADETGSLFVVNDRPDLALRCEADGVHVGQRDLPVPQVRELVGDELLVGLSAHTPAQIAAAGGVDVVQLRAKDAPDDEIVAAGRVFRHVADETGSLFVVNDRPDLALRCEADGVHVGQGDLPVPRVRELVGDDMLVGLSAHTSAQIAAADGADYLGIGPVFATPTKEEAEAFGLELVREAARTSRVPWFAIGGIDLSTLDEVLAAGATRVAVVRAIADAPDPRAAAHSLRSSLAAARR